MHQDSHDLPMAGYKEEAALEAHQAHTNSMVDGTIFETPKSCIHTIFKERVAQQPQAEAVCAWDKKFSYAELDDLSTILAGQLIELGVKEEVLVPLCFEKSAWTIVAMLGVLKAGGGFVPLDPSFPLKRLGEIVHHTEAHVILCSFQHLNMCKPLVPHVLTVDAAITTKSAAIDTGSDILTHPESAAYVIFTSGSTGVPKGVVVEHQAFSSCALAHGPAHRIDSKSRVLQFASYSFDACLVEILTTLLMGGCCCVPSEAARVDNLAKAINDLHVNLAILTPTVAGLLDPRSVPSLRTLVMVGETMQQIQIQDWKGISHFLCAYGPTEASVSAMVNSKVNEETGHTNLGRAVGCQVWIVDADDHNHLVGTGTIGEAIIEGPNLARGYLKDEVKTSASFVSNINWGVGRRFYKTGDLMRQNQDGSFTFVGRKDTQIKIRGQRTEVFEIEKCLLEDERISHATVLWPKRGPLKDRLVALIVLQAHSDTSFQSLNPNILEGDHLRGAVGCLKDLKIRAEERLPGFMVPSNILPITSMPLLLSGKVDRNKLVQIIHDVNRDIIEQIEQIERPTQHNSKLEATESQRTMIEVWADVLNIPQETIKLEKSFLAMGGDSISAMQVVANCRSKGIKLSVKDILKYKSIEQISPHATLGIRFSYAVEQSPGIDFGLSPIQQLFFYTNAAGENHFNQSFLLRLRRNVNPSDLRAALHQVVMRHSMLRARFNQAKSGAWTQCVNRDVDMSYILKVHNVEGNHEICSIIESRQKVLDILHGPTFAADLFHVAKEQYLSLIAHHLVVDLVSWRIIIQDLEDVLLHKGMLGDVPLPFQDWQHLQSHHNPKHQIENTPDSKCARDFWEVKDNCHASVIEEHFNLDSETTNSLIRSDECHKAMRTEPLDIFLAALISTFRQEFSEYGVQRIFIEGHGRETWDPEIDLSQTVGWFTTLYPLTVPCSAADSLLDVVRKTKDMRRKSQARSQNYLMSRFHPYQDDPCQRRSGEMDFVFNYSGLYQQFEKQNSLFEQLGSSKESVAGSMPRFSLFDIEATVERDELHFNFRYNQNMLHQDRIRKWIHATKAALEQLTSELKLSPFQYTLSDFPQAQLDYDSLRELTEKQTLLNNIPSDMPIMDIYPCANLQQGILLSQVAGSAAYNTRTLWEVEPAPGTIKVEIEKLEKAWKQVVLHHPALRTVFAENVGNMNSFHQIVLQTTRVDIVHCEWNKESSELHQPRLRTEDVINFPHQFAIYQAAQNRVFCSLSISHALMDGLSMDNIVRDILLAYDDKLPFAKPDVYSEYVGYLQEQEVSLSLDYWRAQLIDVEPCLFPRLENTIHSDTRVSSIRSMIPPDAAQRVWDFCKMSSITLSTLGQVAWSLVLQSYTGHDDVCFGYLVSGRDAPIDGIEDAVGAFANLLVCRTNLTSTDSVSQLLQFMQTRFLENGEHQFVSLAQIHNTLGLSSLFNTIMSYQRHDVSKVAVESSIEFEKKGTYDPSEYDVALGIDVFAGRIFLKMDFLSSVLSNDSAQHVLETFKTILVSLTENFDKRLQNLDRVGAQGWQTILSFTIPEAEKVKESISSIIIARCEDRPDHAAIEAWDVRLSRTELLLAANHVAQDLNALGIGPGSVVPLLFEKSGWTIVALLAVMLSGGAFVLLDSSHPTLRLKEIITQVSADIIVASSKHAKLASTMVDRTYTIDDQLLLSDDVQKNMSRWEAAGPDDVAFIIFTSGSTGKPKGVVLEHGAFASAAKAQAEALGLSSQSRVIQFASYSFDACMLEILTTLMVGGVVCVPSEDEKAKNLAQTLRQRNISWANLTPLVAELLVQEHLPALKTLVVAGEAMTKEHLHSWEGKDIHVINGYGPTEASVAATLNSKAVNSIPSDIGRPVGSRLWLVDSHNQPVPIGAVGEIILDGPTLARGYLKDQHQTAASFIPPPAWLKTRYEYVYKTGDMARYRSDGTISFVGRRQTSQVKIRGQRVELQEIENRIRQSSPNLQGVVVIVEKTSNNRSRLVAFVVLPTADMRCSSGVLSEEGRACLLKLRINLQQSLPRYMVPDIFIPIDKLPLRLSGKLDRGRLQDVFAGLSPHEKEVFAFLTREIESDTTDNEMKRTLRTLWMKVLGSETSQIMSNSNFFAVGGDSILAMKLSTIANGQGLPLTVSVIFQHPTLAGMASYIGSNKAGVPVNSPIVQPFSLLKITDSIDVIRNAVAHRYNILPSIIGDIYPCTSLQEGLIALSARKTGSYQAQFMLRLSNDLDVDHFKQSWEKLVASTDILRSRIVVYGGTLLQVVLDEQVNWHHSSEQAIDNALKPKTLNMGVGSPLQISEILTNSEGVYFRLTIHHSVYDGISLALLFQQLHMIYNDLETLPLLSFKQFISHLSNRPDNSQSFWRSQVAGSMLKTFPGNAPENVISPKHESISRNLQVGTGRTTTSTLLRAVWSIVIARLTSSFDVLFGAVLSGRNLAVAGVANIVGPMTTTVPLCVKLDTFQTASELLDMLQNQAIEMIPYEHDGLPAITEMTKVTQISKLQSILVIQSLATEVDSLECLGSQVKVATDLGFDTYPLILEFKPLTNDAGVLNARFDPSILVPEVMNVVLDDIERVVRLFKEDLSMTVGEICATAVEDLRRETTIIDDRLSQGSISSDTDAISDPASCSSSYPPSSEHEVSLQEIWSNLLAIPAEKIQTNDNFFRLGGDSIKAIKLTAALRDQSLILSVATIFTHPILQDMAKQVNQIVAEAIDIAPFSLVDHEKDDILSNAAAQCGVIDSGIEDIYPCTALQEGLIALSIKQAGAYVAQHVYRLPESIDIETFMGAWESVGMLHGILRTRIVLHDATMLQVLMKSGIQFERIAVHNSDEIFHQTTVKPDFGTPLCRFTLASVNENQNYFILSLHHATFDSWTLPRLFEDSSKIYEGVAPKSPVTYQSFINHTLKADKRASKSFWSDYFLGLDTAHFPQINSSSYSPAETKSVTYRVSLIHQEKSEVTTSTMLKAAWAITLRNYSNCEDVVFCTTLSGRNVQLQGIMEVDGPTIATVPIRATIKAEHSLSGFLHALQAQSSEMIPFEQYGMQNIRRASKDASNACDAPNLLVIQFNEDIENKLPLGLEVIENPTPKRSSYPLALECRINSAIVELSGYYDESIVSRPLMERMLFHFEHVLGQLQLNTATTLGCLTRISLYDQHTLEAWNETVPPVVEKCIHAITHERALELPDSQAVWAWDVQFSHSQLDRLSSSLAYDLVKAGLQPEDIVPVCFERSGWIVVAMLGILKAGGAFLPWDPAHPAERRQAMIDQTKSRIIVTSSSQEGVVSGLADIVFVLDPTSLQNRREFFDVYSNPHTSAYVIYTSGSTGKPKGVVIEHKAYTTSALLHGPVHHISSTSRVSQFASYSVDAICLEILTTIMMGGCTCICDDAMRSNDFANAMSEMCISVSALTPSVLSLLSPQDLPDLKTVIMVGEAASKSLVELWEPHVHLINGYGPTETSLSAVMNENMTSSSQSNIGRAVNCVSWIADANDHNVLVPIGCIGELLCEGPTLARGYLHDRVKTATSFVHNPTWLSSRSGRIYKTGDLVRYEPDGSIIFIGRKDMQVKINGHRIELGEIEHYIRSSFAIAKQTVVDTIIGEQSRMLVAFMVLEIQNKDAPGSTGVLTIKDELRAQLGALESSLRLKLPGYMVPSLWIPLAKIPVASSGKVDRKHLQKIANAIWATDKAQYTLSVGTKRPPTGLSLTLRNLWVRALNIDGKEIGADDNFFRVGGDSVSAMKLAGHAAKAGYDISVAAIFHHPSLESMAQYLSPKQNILQNKTEVVPATSNSTAVIKDIQHRFSGTIEDIVPATDFQAWSFAYGLLNGGFITYMSLVPSQPLSIERLLAACQKTVSAHAILRTTFIVHGIEILQVILKETTNVFEAIKCDKDIETSYDEWLAAQKSVREGESIIKFALFHHGEDQRLVLRISHAQYDGISFPQVWDTLNRAYANDDISPYQPFSAFIRDSANKDIATKYWKEVLNGSKMTSLLRTTRLSYDRPLNELIGTSIELPKLDGNCTVATVVKAAWALILSKLTDQEDIVFGCLVSGRNSTPYRDIFGPCINTAPTRVVLNPTWKVQDLLHHIQEQQTDSLAHESLGFREIFRAADWPGWTRYSSVVQHQNIPELKRKVMVGDVHCRTSAYRHDIDTSDVAILSTVEEGKLKLELAYNGSSVPSTDATTWLAALCRFVSELPSLLSADITSVIESHLVDIKPSGNLLDRTPVDFSAAGSGRAYDFHAPHINEIEGRLKLLWREIFELSTDEILPEASFTDNGGDIVAICKLACRLQQEKFEVMMHELVDNDSLEEQVALLMLKQKTSEPLATL